ncbi:MAG TPA: N-acetylmuramic acid 6-phosphate etherase [Vicinamibacteria bacterium]|nr:N-acetylmuramic acid 6-phosphate etherase [Vicinamibacteria bacterium]
MTRRPSRRPRRAGRASSTWAGLPTEGRNPRSARLDALSTARVVSLLLEEDARAVAAAAKTKAAVTRAAVLVADALGRGGRVVFFGAGTSGRLGILEAAECPPTFGTDPDDIRGVMAGGEEAVFRAVEGAEDRADEGREEAARLRVGDVLVGVSASSVTPFVRGALESARARGLGTVLVTCAPAAGRRRLADVVIAIPTGPEVLAGSTRLKAASATKAVLNAITTAAMVRLGKAYENLMVDFKLTNAKLRDRGRRIVVSAGGVTAPEAERLLGEADGHVKTAIVMARLGVPADEARRRITAAGGHVRRALSPSRTR